MGSAIGDYIHLHASRYAAFGIDRAEGLSEENVKSRDGYTQGKQVMSEYVNQRKTYFENQAKSFKLDADSDSTFLQTLKDLINSWENSDPQGSYEQGLKEGVDIVKQILQETFGKDVAEKVLKMTVEKFSAIIDGGATDEQKVKAKGISKIKVDGKTQHHVRTIRDLLDDINVGLTMLLNSGSMTKEKVNNLQNQVKGLQLQLATFDNYAQQMRSGEVKYKNQMTKAESLDSLNDLTGTQRGHKLKNTRAVTNFYNRINNIVGQLKGLQGIKSRYVGDAFQLAIAVASQIAADKGLQGIRDMLRQDMKNKTSKQIWSGGLQTTTTFQGISFEKSVDVSKVFGKNYKTQQDSMGNWDITTSASQDKVDVGFSLGGRDYLVSAKNYALHGGTAQVHIVSGAPLLTLLLAQTNAQFINHYLNIVAVRDTHQNQNFQDAEKAKQVAKEAIQVLILEASLQGYRDTKANVFIINDSNTGTIRMITIADLFNTVISNLDAYLNVENPGTQIRNVFDKDNPNDRITSLLRDVYNYKIKASISGKALIAAATEKMTIS